jgi:hypothetical protein
MAVERRQQPGQEAGDGVDHGEEDVGAGESHHELGRQRAVGGEGTQRTTSIRFRGGGTGVSRA